MRHSEPPRDIRQCLFLVLRTARRGRKGGLSLASDHNDSPTTKNDAPKKATVSRSRNCPLSTSAPPPRPPKKNTREEILLWNCSVALDGVGGVSAWGGPVTAP